MNISNILLRHYYSYLGISGKWIYILYQASPYTVTNLIMTYFRTQSVYFRVRLENSDKLYFVSQPNDEVTSTEFKYVLQFAICILHRDT